MKTIFRIFSIVLCACSLQFVSCSNPSPQPVTDIQLDKLKANWKATQVTSDGVTQNGYSNLILAFTGSAGSKSVNYAASGRPFVSPWKETGTFTFDTTRPTELLRRDDGLDVEYVVTATTLTIQFNFSGPGYVSSRTSALTGKWIFEFQKQ